MMKRLFIALFLLTFPLKFFSQSNDNSIFMDFRNQKISDVIYALADICEESVFVDETVSGNVTFHFEDKDFESALSRFCDYCHLYVTNDNGVYRVSQVKLSINDRKSIFLNGENVMLEPLLNYLSRVTNTTILYDTLPVSTITIRVENESLENILNLIIIKLPGFGLERIASGYYITKSSGTNIRRNVDVFTVSKADNLFSVSIQKATFLNVLEALFVKGEKEYSLLYKPTIQLEGIAYKNKTFDELLSLLLEQASCDYTIENNIYKIFEIQKRDINKKFKTTKTIFLKHISTEVLLQLLPSELNNSAFIKLDKNNGVVVLNGSEAEISPIEAFIEKIDVNCENRFFKQFEIVNLDVKEAVSLIPKHLLLSDPVILPSNTAFITQVTTENEKELSDFIKMIDSQKNNYSITLKYIKSDELIKSLPAWVAKEKITQTSNPSLVFYNGNSTQYKALLSDIEKIDRPKQQIKYQLLVIQRQKTNGMNIGSSLKVNTSDEQAGYGWSGMLSNIFNIKFDIISQFGLQFAGNLNAELSLGKAHVLADTTLNGISGESISFSNTNTSRYRDIIVNGSGDVYTSTTREITSGLTLKIDGWVSGDEMITVSIEAQVSKQGSSSGNADVTSAPPSTTEKKVSTNVRTKSGEPVIIGGLFQQETDITENRVPVLGSVPLLGNLFKTQKENVAETEFIIYLVPFVEKDKNEGLTEKENLMRLISKYGK